MRLARSFTYVAVLAASTFAWGYVFLKLGDESSGGDAVSVASEPGAGYHVAAPAELNDSNQTDSADRARNRRNWLRRFGSRRVSVHEKSHTRVKTAFRPIVAKASQSTAKLLNDDRKRLALATIVSSDGYLVTKASEIEDRLIVTCVLREGKSFPAAVVATDDAYDLALLKADAPEQLTPIAWRKGDDPIVGSFVATADAAGDPLATGVVSVAVRKLKSGGGFLGVGLDEVAKGPRINRILPGSGAAKAGLRVNDIVTGVNQLAVDTREALIDAISNMRPGARVRLKVLRGDGEITVEAVLGKRPQVGGSNRQQFQNRLGGELSKRRGEFPQVLQHDTVLLPSQCGGPLVDLDGRAVGVNIARAGRVVSYAVPASAVQRLVAELRAQGKAQLEQDRKKVAELRRKIEQREKSVSEFKKIRDKTASALAKLTGAEGEKKPAPALIERTRKAAEAAAERFLKAQKQLDDDSASLGKLVAKLKILES